MRIRVVGSGIVAGVFCLIALWFPWYMMEPGGIVQDWTYQKEAASFPGWLPTAAYIFCALTIFAFGWVAARWNWSKTWRSSLLAGAGAGLIAGCIIYDFIGAFRFGVAGQAEVWQAFYREVGVTEGLTLLVDAIVSSATLVYFNFIAIVIGCVLLGALGGLSSSIDLEDVWGKPPRDSEEWLFRLPAYSLSLTGAVCFIVAIAAFMVMEEAATNVMIDENLTGLNAPPIFILIACYTGCLVMVMLPIGLTWGWIFRAWKEAGLWKFFYGVWLAVTIFFTGWVLQDFFIQDKTAFLIDMLSVFPVLFIPFSVIGGLGLGLICGLMCMPVSPSSEKYRFSDWLGYALTQGILGGTQMFMSVTAYALVLVLITIENIPHLTQVGVVDLSPAGQLAQLFKTLSGVAQGMMIASAVGGWLFGLVILLFRKFLKIRPAQAENPDTIHP